MMLPILLATMPDALQIADVAEFRAPIVRRLEAEWPNNRTFTVVCHGHSVPAGYFKTPEVRPFDSYPHLLHRALSKKYPHAVINVIVTAIGGEESDRGAARFADDVLALKPDVITLDYGLNDRRIGLDKARIAWESMIEQAKAKGVAVILLTPSWDLSVSIASSSDPLPQHADQIRQLARKHRVGFADSTEAFVQAFANGTKLESLMSQVNHPNRAGHELILKGLLPWFGIEPRTGIPSRSAKIRA